MHFPRGLHLIIQHAATGRVAEGSSRGPLRGQPTAPARGSPRVGLGGLARSALHRRGPLTASVREHQICPTSARNRARLASRVSSAALLLRNLAFGTGPSADTRERRAGLPSSMSRVGGDSRSASLPTRLETRTKESNLCASRGARSRSPLPRRSESERSTFVAPQPARSPPSGFPFAERGAARTRASRFLPAARSWSVHVGTRKMVIYARAGRSQRKLWWKPAAILTCKSIVGPWHRGERLIEPSSSWFPPKFPSG